MTILQAHCKFLFANKSAVCAMAPPSIAPSKASFTTQLFGAVFGHSTPVSRSTTTVVVPHPNNPALIAAGGQPQTHVIPTVSPTVLGTVVLANKRTFENAKQTASAFASLAKTNPTIPGDVRMALPILGLVERTELREIFVPALVRLFAATEPLRVPVEAPKADYFRNLMGAELVPIIASGGGDSAAEGVGGGGAGAASPLSSSSPTSLQNSHQQLSSPAAYLSLMLGSAAIADLTLQEVMWSMLVPCEVPQPPAEDDESNTAVNKNNNDHHAAEAAASTMVTTTAENNKGLSLILNPKSKRGLGTLDLVTETMLVCNRVRRGDSASPSPSAFFSSSASSSASAATIVSQFDHFLFGSADSVSITVGSRLVRMILARRTRPTVCPLSPTAPCLKGSSSAALQLLNEILLMPSSSAAASDNAFSWFDKKLGAGASAAATNASSLNNAGLMVYGGVGNSGAGFITKASAPQIPSSSLVGGANSGHATTASKITPIAPFAATMPQSLLLGSLDLFKARLRHCPDVTTVAGGGGANAGGTHSALTTAYVDSRGIALEQFIIEWAKGVTTRLTDVVVRLANRNPFDAAAAYLAQQLTLHLAPDAIAPAVAVAAVAGPTVNKILTTITGRNAVTATAFPALEPLIKAVDVSTLFDRLQRVPNISASPDVSCVVSTFWGHLPSDLFWLLYSSLHITTIKNDPNYSEPLRERGARALAQIITDSCVANVIAAPSSGSVVPPSTTSNTHTNDGSHTSSGDPAAAALNNNQQRPLEAVMLTHWALLFAEENWSRVEDLFLALPDKRLLEVLAARPKLQQSFLAAHESDPQFYHIVAQLHQQQQQQH